MTDRDDLGMADVIRLHTAAALARAHVAMPGRVQSFDPERNTVDVIPEMDRAIETANGEILRERLPVLPSVPVAWPRSGSWALTFPLPAGSEVLVVVTDRALGEWRRNGSLDPRQLGTHRLDGAIAIPGISTLANAIPSAKIPSDGMRLGWVGEGDGPEITMAPGFLSAKITNSGIEVLLSSAFDRVLAHSGGTTDWVVQVNKLALELTAIAASIASISASINGLGGAPITSYTPGGDLGTSKFRAE